MSNVKTKMDIPQHAETKWRHIDANGRALGRVAAQIAALLRGKHKPYFSPDRACGDFVVVTNAQGIKLTGNKDVQKKKYTHSGYPGNLRAENYGEFLERAPEKVLMKAVAGMLPHNALGRKLLKRLKVYAGPDHPHQAQQPETIEE